MLENNQDAPLFSAPDQNGHIVSLAGFKGKKNVVLYFYPKDDTSGCTTEANQFTALLDDFAGLDTVVLGVSKDSSDSHRAFIDKYDLGMDLLSDTDDTLCELYRVWQLKEKNGEKKMGIVRSTYIIDKDGKLVEAMYAVAADGHAQQVLDRIRSM